MRVSPDVKAAVKWAAQQAWSNGKVGMWGKSYDAWTQVMALATKPKGLAATVIQSAAGSRSRTACTGAPAVTSRRACTPPTTCSLAGLTKVTVDATTSLPVGGNLVALLYDVAADGSSRLVTRGAYKEAAPA